jgi:hypothetical protein
MKGMKHVVIYLTTYSFHGHQKFTNSCNWQCSKLLFSFLCCFLLCFSSSCVLCVQCWQFLCIVHSWSLLRFSLTFICPLSCVLLVTSVSGLSIIQNRQSRIDHPEWIIQNGSSRMDNPEWTIQNGPSRMEFWIVYSGLSILDYPFWIVHSGLSIQDCPFWMVHSGWSILDCPFLIVYSWLSIVDCLFLIVYCGYQE